MSLIVRAATLALLASAAPLALRPAEAQAISTDYAAAPGGSYALDPAHTSVTLKVSHLGLSAYTLRMDGVRGSYGFDPAHPETSKLQVEIDAASVDTGDAAFNRQIAEQVLEAAKYPTDPLRLHGREAGTGGARPGGGRSHPARPDPPGDFGRGVQRLWLDAAAERGADGLLRQRHGAPVRLRGRQVRSPWWATR